jgi:ribose transport system substrate-binding protein
LNVTRNEILRRASNFECLNGEVNMKRMKRAALAMLALAMAFTSGCQRHSNKEVYYLVASNLSLPYWESAVAGFKKAADQYRVTAKVAGPDTHDAQAELAEMQKAIAAKPAGILISATDPAVVQPGINAATAAGIPVITMDSDAPGSSRLFFIGTNNLEAGRLGGRRVVAKTGGRGNVVFFTIAGQHNMSERLKGFQDVFSGYPNLKIVEVFDTKGDARNAFDRAEQLVAQTGPKKIDVFVCLDSASGKQVADIVKRANATDREVLAWDIDQGTLDDINAGLIDATIVQKPFTMGAVGLKELDEVFHNPPRQLSKDYAQDPFSAYPVFIDTGTSLVDKNNVSIYLREAAGAKK